MRVALTPAVSLPSGRQPCGRDAIQSGGVLQCADLLEAGCTEQGANRGTLLEPMLQKQHAGVSQTQLRCGADHAQRVQAILARSQGICRFEPQVALCQVRIGRASCRERVLVTV